MATPLAPPGRPVGALAVEPAAIRLPAPVAMEMYTRPMGAAVDTLRPLDVPTSEVEARAKVETTEASMSPRAVETLTMWGGVALARPPAAGESADRGLPMRMGPRNRVYCRPPPMSPAAEEVKTGPPNPRGICLF